MFCGIDNVTDTEYANKQLVDAFRAAQWDLDTGEWSAISKSDLFYVSVQCHRDLSLDDCEECFNYGKHRVSACLPANEGRLYLDGCFLRYDINDFSQEEFHKIDKVVCSPADDLSKDLERLQFGVKVGHLMSSLTDIAIERNGFGAKSVEGDGFRVYSLAQCGAVDEQVCQHCLTSARTRILDCVPGFEGRVLSPSCFMRYSSQQFYDPKAEEYNYEHQRKVKVQFHQPQLHVQLTAIFMFFLSGCIHVFSGYNNVDRISSFIGNSALHFKYEDLEWATESFTPERKLGQGAAGTVFKGTLPDGRTVAVKRLAFNTRQWADEFFNEVNLINGIQHKNLVRLLGCSIEGPESLLVYEYVPNKSLDQLLFGKNTTQVLTWQQRLNIIVGIAEGLAFLHGCQEKIIHRDIKGSNIMLNDDLTPKIADFGLARRISGDKTHVSTGIAGTLGYLAPEYLVRGQLTDKADVYAFGVLILEIVCGKKNSVFTDKSNSLLHIVWKNYRSSKITASVDPRLDGHFPEKKASDVLQLGLLCTQASMTERPSMNDAVKMLTDDEYEIPQPKKAPFLNASLLTDDPCTGQTTSFTSSIGSSMFTAPETSSSSSFDDLEANASSQSRRNSSR
ncbi:Gnk2-homologous domain [Dillenia turbinata]|uniref:Gnk2-homologous domain n=1 Tax=Dillenia turbinata TaxID=194707 RepID=A0AAN8UZ48_9MAGN